MWGSAVTQAAGYSGAGRDAGIRARVRAGRDEGFRLRPDHFAAEIGRALRLRVHHIFF